MPNSKYKRTGDLVWIADSNGGTHYPVYEDEHGKFVFDGEKQRNYISIMHEWDDEAFTIFLRTFDKSLMFGGEGAHLVQGKPYEPKKEN